MKQSATPIMRIILIDDDPDHIIIIRRAIKDLETHNEIISMENSSEALEWLRAQEVLPDLILLDINMPGMSGFDLLKALKAESRLKAVPVVMLTSSELSTDIARAYELGASGYISKPSYLHDLRAVLGNTLMYWSVMKRATATGRSTP